MILIKNNNAFSRAVSNIYLDRKNYEYDVSGYKICEKYIARIYLKDSIGFSEIETSEHKRAVLSCFTLGKSSLRFDEYANKIYAELLAKSISLSLGNKILLSEYLSPRVGELLLEEGIFTNKNIINKIALSDSPMAYKCIGLCDIKTLKKLKKSKHKKFRALVYQRLGPVECLDDMLADKDRNIRILGAMYAPKNYEYFDKMIKDRSDAVFRFVCKKIKKELLPMMLGSGHIKKPKLSQYWHRNREASKIINSRLNN